jgi:hypothetical protein
VATQAKLCAGGSLAQLIERVMDSAEVVSARRQGSKLAAQHVALRESSGGYAVVGETAASRGLLTRR